MAEPVIPPDENVQLEAEEEEESPALKFALYLSRGVVHQFFLNFRWTQLLGLFLSTTVLIVFSNIEFDDRWPRANEAFAGSLSLVIAWVFEALPIPIVSVLPMVIFPLLEVNTSGEVAGAYYNEITFTFLGSWLILTTLEDSGADKRLMMKALLVLPKRPKLLVLLVLLVSATLSMFVPNVSAVIALLPLATGLKFVSIDQHPRFIQSFLLAMAYGATCGGVATLTGTAETKAFVTLFSSKFPGAPEITFSLWFSWAWPISLVMLFITWIIISRYCLGSLEIDLGADALSFELESLGPLQRDEVVAWCAHLLMVLLLILCPYVISPYLGSCSVGASTNQFSCEAAAGVWIPYVTEGSVVCTVAMLMFFIPSATSDLSRTEAKNGAGSRSIYGPLLSQKSFFELRWDILLLLGAGFTIAQACQSSGLLSLLGERYGNFTTQQPFGYLIFTSYFVMLTKEIVSGPAAVDLLTPILDRAVIEQLNPFLIGLPTAVSTSLTFVLPMATPAYLVVYATGRIPMREMFRIGAYIATFSFLVVTLFTLGNRNVFGNFANFPAWAT